MSKSTLERQINHSVDRVKETVHNAAETVSTVAENVAETASNIRAGVGDAASYVREKAENATSTVGEALENTGHYLRDDGIQNLTTDLTNIIRRNPVPALLAGIAAGYLLAHAMNKNIDPRLPRGHHG